MNLPNTDVLLKNSIINCHAIGVDSIVIRAEAPMVRIFIARHEHHLWRNDLTRDNPMSVGLHAHHCDVTLIPLKGNIYNVVFSKQIGDGTGLRNLSAYRYESPITSGSGHFQHLHGPVTVAMAQYLLDRPEWLAATKMHSILVHQDCEAAWMVIEGDENPAHQPITLSDDKLEDFDFSKINQPMTRERLYQDLQIIGVRLLSEVVNVQS